MLPVEIVQPVPAHHAPRAELQNQRAAGQILWEPKRSDCQRPQQVQGAGKIRSQAGLEKGALGHPPSLEPPRPRPPEAFWGLGHLTTPTGSRAPCAGPERRQAQQARIPNLPPQDRSLGARTAGC